MSDAAPAPAASAASSPAAFPAGGPAQPVPMGQAGVGEAGDQLAIYGLGSCVAVAVWHPATRRGALCHVVLPEGVPAPGDPPARYADAAVEWVRRTFAAVPAVELVVKLAGGASVLPVPRHLPMLDIGRRNSEAVQQALLRHGLTPRAADLGGTVGRTVVFHTLDGRLTVRTAGRGERDL